MVVIAIGSTLHVESVVQSWGHRCQPADPAPLYRPYYFRFPRQASFHRRTLLAFPCWSEWDRGLVELSTRLRLLGLLIRSAGTVLYRQHSDHILDTRVSVNETYIIDGRCCSQFTSNDGSMSTDTSDRTSGIFTYLPNFFRSFSDLRCRGVVSVNRDSRHASSPSRPRPS